MSSLYLPSRSSNEVSWMKQHFFIVDFNTHTSGPGFGSKALETVRVLSKISLSFIPFFNCSLFSVPSSLVFSVPSSLVFAVHISLVLPVSNSSVFSVSTPSFTVVIFSSSTSVKRGINADVEIWTYGRKSRWIPVSKSLTFISETKLHRLV